MVMKWFMTENYHAYNVLLLSAVILLVTGCCVGESGSFSQSTPTPTVITTPSIAVAATVSMIGVVVGLFARYDGISQFEQERYF